MLVQRSVFSFSIEQLGKQKYKFQHKICYRPVNSSLKLKDSPCSSIATRVMRDGKFLKLYRHIHEYYFFYIRQNVKKLSYNNEFKSLYYQYDSFNDLNRVLYWRIFSINTLFNLKKLKKARLLYYLKPERRVVIVLNWLKFIIKMKKKLYANKNPELYLPLTNFLCTNKEKSEVYHLKLKIYRLRLMRG